MSAYGNYIEIIDEKNNCSFPFRENNELNEPEEAHSAKRYK